MDKEMSGLTAEQVETIQSKCKSALDQLVDPRAKVIAEQTIALCDLALAQLRAQRQEPVGFLHWPGLEFHFNGSATGLGATAVNAAPIPLYAAPQPAQVTQDALRQQSGAERDAELLEWACKNPEAAMHRIQSDWSLAGRGCRENYFNFRGAIEYALKERT